MANILKSTEAYENWLRITLKGDVVEADLVKKHQKMKSGGFAFLRATYWRWAEIIFTLCPGLADAPSVLAIGDTHLENFGTWRDGEGRLVWGANDFDDAATMPYGLDLVRLATSAVLARDSSSPSATDIADAILGGYRRGLGAPSPIILERDYKRLRDAVLLPNGERKDFWEKFAALPPAKGPVNDKYLAALRNSLPEPTIPFTAKPRTAGTGSLGRPRYVALIDDWRGGPLLREVKALAMSAWSLCHAPENTDILAGVIAGGRARSVDPQYQVVGDVLVRRLSPNSRKIEVDGDLETLLSPYMLDLMGFEIANCHANDASVIAGILQDLDARDGDWLHAAAKKAAATIDAEQTEYAAG